MPELIASTASGDYPILIRNGALDSIGPLAAESVVGRRAFVVSTTRRSILCTMNR
jgi:hypothetical protein